MGGEGGAVGEGRAFGDLASARRRRPAAALRPMRTHRHLKAGHSNPTYLAAQWHPDGWAGGRMALAPTCIRPPDTLPTLVATPTLSLHDAQSFSIETVQWYPHDNGLFTSSGKPPALTTVIM